MLWTLRCLLSWHSVGWPWSGTGRLSTRSVDGLLEAKFARRRIACGGLLTVWCHLRVGPALNGNSMTACVSSFLSSQHSPHCGASCLCTADRSTATVVCSMQGRQPADLVRALRGTFLHDPMSAHNPVLQPEDFDWAAVGAAVNGLHRTVPGVSCLLGPLEAQVRRHKQQTSWAAGICMQQLSGLCSCRRTILHAAICCFHADATAKYSRCNWHAHATCIHVHPVRPLACNQVVQPCAYLSCLLLIGQGAQGCCAQGQAGSR